MAGPSCSLGSRCYYRQLGGACQFALCCKVRMNSKLPTSTTRAISFNRHSPSPRRTVNPTLFASSAFCFSIGSRRKSRPSDSSKSNAQHTALRVGGSIQRPQVHSRHDPDFLFILFHLFRLLMQLRKSHTHQQRELGPRLKSAFLNTSFFSARPYGQPIYRPTPLW